MTFSNTNQSSNDCQTYPFFSQLIFHLKKKLNIFFPPSFSFSFFFFPFLILSSFLVSFLGSSFLSSTSFPLCQPFFPPLRQYLPSFSFIPSFPSLVFLSWPCFFFLPSLLWKRLGVGNHMSETKGQWLYEGEDVFMKEKMCSWRGRYGFEGRKKILHFWKKK